LIDINKIKIDGLTYNLFYEYIERYQCNYVTEDRRCEYPYWSFRQRCRFVCDEANNFLFIDTECENNNGISVSLLYDLLNKFSKEVKDLSKLRNSLITVGVFEDMEGYASIFKNALLTEEYTKMGIDELLEEISSDPKWFIDTYSKIGYEELDYEFGKIKSEE